MNSHESEPGPGLQESAGDHPNAGPKGRKEGAAQAPGGEERTEEGAMGHPPALLIPLPTRAKRQPQAQPSL